jgi:20S proteasome alpha/beta subunit
MFYHIQRVKLISVSYTDNGGSTLGISGADFAILAGDTRSTSGYNINTRYAPKLFKIGGEGPDNKGARIVLSVVGFAADGDALKERLDTIVKMYKYQHGKPMSVSACAQRLSHILYNKRFFPYYVHAILAGLDEEGKGALYSYDPVGSYEREQCRAAGAAASLISCLSWTTRSTSRTCTSRAAEQVTSSSRNKHSPYHRTTLRIWCGMPSRAPSRGISRLVTGCR